MMTIGSAIFYMSERKAIFQYEESSYSEARSFQDKQINMMGFNS